MDPTLMEKLVIPVFAVMAIGEVLLFERRRGEPFPRAMALRALAIWAFFAIGSEVYKHIAWPLYEYGYRHRVVDLAWAPWLAWTVTFFVEELAYYWLHRLMHQSRWLWAHHGVHHAIERLTYITGLQNGWFGILAGKWLYTLPLAWLGFEPRILMTMMAANLLYNFVLHSEMVPKLGPIEWLFNTPSHHRVHHSYFAQHIDQNFGGILIIFDRLFGTFQAEDAAQTYKFGLHENQETLGPVAINLTPWRKIGRDVLAARTLKAVLHAAFGKMAADAESPQPLKNYHRSA